MINELVGESRCYKVPVQGVSHLYICENAPLERLLLNRRQLPLEFVNNCRDATRMFLQHLEPALDEEPRNVAEMQILTKGYYYWLHNAFEQVFSKNLPINFVATNRVDVGEGGVRVKVHFSNFDAPADTILIGDTVASGETICAALGAYLCVRKVSRVFVLSYAGSVTGAHRIEAFCKSYEIKVVFLYGLAAFGLAQNGFDLSFLHNETITNERYRALAQEAYRGLGISVAGWDFGSQAQAPEKYRSLSRIEANYWGVPESDVFVPASTAIDPDLVQKEQAAFSARLPNVSRLR